MSKKNNKKILAGVGLALLMGIAATGGIIALNNIEGNFTTDVDENKDVDIVDRGIGVRLLNKQTNSYGQVDYTFTYSIKPENATNQNVNVTLAYKGSGDCSSVMTSSVNTAAKTITLSCKAAFDKQIIATVTSEANASAKADITLDYTKKLLSVSKVYDRIQLGGNYDLDLENSVTEFSDNLFYNPNYSIYTKDVTYTFTLAVGTVNFDEFLGAFNMDSDSALESALCTLVENAIKGKKGITDDELWNASSSNAWHSFLMASASDEDEHHVTLIVPYTVSEGGNQKLSHSLEVQIGLYGRNYAGKTVGVDEVTVETPNIEF